MNKAANFKKVAEVGEAIISSMAVADSFKTFVEEKLRQENEQKQAKANESKSV